MNDRRRHEHESSASTLDRMVDALVVGAMTDKRLTDRELELLVVGIRWGEKPRWEKVLNALEELAELRIVARDIRADLAGPLEEGDLYTCYVAAGDAVNTLTAMGYIREEDE